ncbi:MAG: hypothetical protein LLF76_02615 [Planctomycetaceae bacterium]|nr:hypothetical protein [Planctomycetaceae bacterium]
MATLMLTIALAHFPAEEYTVIEKAAIRNQCFGEDFIILLAIRKAENGGPGKEFGVMNPKAHNLDTQAGWAAATIVKNRKRWKCTNRKDSFIEFLGKRYAPVGANNDPKGLNRHWVKNVTRWVQMLSA